MSTVVNGNPPKWWEVYQGDDEARLFRALARDENHDWRTTQGLAKAAKLSQQRVEEIIKKYLPTGVVKNHPEDQNKWQYWERSKPKSAKGSVAEENKKKRIDDVKKAATP
jgi:hypothetical protein